MSSTEAGQIANLRETKRRLNIPDSDSASDLKIQDYIQESDNFVNIQVSPHATTPLTNPSPELVSLASSLAAAIYNYWQTPIKDRNLEGIKEWKDFIAKHIDGVYARKSGAGLGGGELFGSTAGFAP
jgi:hypothetical protein